MPNNRVLVLKKYFAMLKNLRTLEPLDSVLYDENIDTYCSRYAPGVGFPTLIVISQDQAARRPRGFNYLAKYHSN